MITNFSLDLNDEQRRAVAQHVGVRGMATRRTIKAWVLGLVDNKLNDLGVEAARPVVAAAKPEPEPEPEPVVVAPKKKQRRQAA